MAVHETSSSGRISKRIITALGRGSAGHAGPALRVEMTWLALLHLGLHAAVPGGIALLFFRPNWKRAWLIMISTMMVDLDHLLADPIYDPARCGIGFHPLHTYPAIAAYAVLLVPRVTRLMALGLVIHMALDALDCVWKQHELPARASSGVQAIADCATNVVDATVDAFRRNIAWDRVMKRFAEAQG